MRGLNAGVLAGLLVGLLLLNWGLALRAAQIMPPFENADEAEHFLYAHSIAVRGALPVIPDRDALDAADSALTRWNNHAHHPPLYYLLSVLAISGTDRSQLDAHLRPNPIIFVRGVAADNPNKWLHPFIPPDDQTPQAVYLLRTFSALTGLLTLALIVRATGWLLPGQVRRRLPLLAVAFAGLLPTFLSVHSAVSNDPLVILFVTAGLTWCLWTLRRSQLTARGDLAIALLLAGAVLTKLTGVALWPAVLLTLLIGWWRGDFTLRRALQTLGVALVLSGLLAGWWFLRNIQLYGDPLALAATEALWGRLYDLTPGDPLAELLRLARTFVMMFGYRHAPVTAPLWFEALLLALIGLAGLGALIGLRRRQRLGASGRVLLIALAAVTVLLFTGTRSVDISYGRLLLPALLPIAAVLAGWGWRHLPGWVAPLALTTYAVGAVIVINTTLPAAYPRLTAIDALPASATPVDWRVGDLRIHGLELHTTTLAPGDAAAISIYFSGDHPANPALSLRLVDSLSGALFATTEQYPGMAPTDSLPPGLYRAPLRLDVTAPPGPLSPRALRLEIGWLDVVSGRRLAYDQGDGTLSDAIVWAAPDYQPDPAAQLLDVQFGDAITLTGVSLPTARLRPGTVATLDLTWRMHAPLTPPHVLTVQLFDAAGQFITQADGEIAGLPSPLWQPSMQMQDRRTLALPDDLPPGDYTLRLGWYRLDDLQRLPVGGGAAQDGLALLPGTLTIGEPSP